MEKKEEIKENKTSKKEKVYKKYFVDFSDPLNIKYIKIFYNLYFRYLKKMSDRSIN